MAEKYTDFMVFKLKDTGERVQLDITEEEFSKNNAQAILEDTEVIIIIKESIRRIYIWKGIESSVRKKFIGSRVASRLQKELTQNANFHRCKVVSIDQGDELQEFLDNFNLKRIKKEKPPEKREPVKEIYKYEPKVKPLSSSYGATLNRSSITKDTKKIDFQTSPKIDLNKLIDDNHNEKILEKILKDNPPNGYDRKHIMIGKALLYGEVEKESQVFGNKIQEKNWEPFKNFKKEIIEMDNYNLRIHVDNDINAIEAIEILENQNKNTEKEKEKEREPKFQYQYSKWTINNLRKFCKENNLEIPSGSKKADILRIIKDNLNA
jgi:hypothetical protein